MSEWITDENTNEYKIRSNRRNWAAEFADSYSDLSSHVDGRPTSGRLLASAAAETRGASLGAHDDSFSGLSQQLERVSMSSVKDLHHPLSASQYPRPSDKDLSTVDDARPNKASDEPGPYNILRVQAGVDAERITDPILYLQGARSATRVSGIRERQDRLDPRYTYRPSTFFKRGKVFKILWPEPAGRENPSVTLVSHPSGENILAKIRWFVVIREGPNYCSCLPIQTHNAQGVGKFPRGSPERSNHAIIHSKTVPPAPTLEELPIGNERGMKSPIRVKLRSRSDQMDPMSRINFLKIYTIEHNVKVYEVGDVHEDSMRRFMRHFAESWNISDESERWAKEMEDRRAEDAEISATESTPGTSQFVPLASEPDWMSPDYGQPPEIDFDEEATRVSAIRNAWVRTWQQGLNITDLGRAAALQQMNYFDLRRYLYQNNAMPQEWATAWAAQKKRIAQAQEKSQR